MQGITVLFIAFKSVLSLELKKRDNDRKVMALLTEMKKMLWVLIELRRLLPQPTYSDIIVLVIATAGGRLQTLLQEIATEIGECGTICKAYVNENRLVKRIRSSKYQGELADFSSKFQQRTEDIKLALGIHTARSTDEINTSIGHVLTNVETMGHKLEMILQRLPPSRFTADQELRTFIEYA
ncbi:hypothetical protein B0H10DRAFT_1815766 [Mycena sp. CBHHK59/15]|nr:hypothetical protein B0H10DRAFT_1815766 [Mycena sp. CBHHK59/15]